VNDFAYNPSGFTPKAEPGVSAAPPPSIPKTASSPGTTPPAPPAPTMHELRIIAAVPLPAGDQRAQSRIVASLDSAIEAFTEALKAGDPAARVGVQIVRTKQKGAS
jgi:hypothetical protein